MIFWTTNLFYVLLFCLLPGVNKYINRHFIFDLIKMPIQKLRLITAFTPHKVMIVKSSGHNKKCRITYKFFFFSIFSTALQFITIILLAIFKIYSTKQQHV